ncbi:MAG: fumarylacetoacetate hydrolase family protein [Nitrospinaceae bacterium]
MGTTFHLGAGTPNPNRIFCVGKNYREHIRELNDGVPDQPVIFMKPASCLVGEGELIRLPRHGSCLHHEVEIAVLIGKKGENIAENQAGSLIAGVTLGLDLTLRDVQSDLKKRGLPWELSKAFDQSAPIGTILPASSPSILQNLSFQCLVNGQIRQRGNTNDMIYPIPHIIHFLSGIWELQPGDLIFTGTPSGVGPLRSGDQITIESGKIGKFSWKIAAHAQRQ